MGVTGIIMDLPEIAVNVICVLFQTFAQSQCIQGQCLNPPHTPPQILGTGCIQIRLGMLTYSTSLST